MLSLVWCALSVDPCFGALRYCGALMPPPFTAIFVPPLVLGLFARWMHTTSISHTAHTDKALDRRKGSSNRDEAGHSLHRVHGRVRSRLRCASCSEEQLCATGGARWSLDCCCGGQSADEHCHRHGEDEGEHWGNQVHLCVGGVLVFLAAVSIACKCMHKSFLQA